MLFNLSSFVKEYKAVSAKSLPSVKPGLSLKTGLLLLVAAFINSIAFIFVNYAAALLSVAILIYLILNCDSKKQTVYAGFLFGGISSLLLNYWMIPVVSDYVKAHLTIGLLCYLASAMVLAVFFAAPIYLYAILKVKESNKYSFINNALLFTCLWILFEWIRGEVFSALPWLSYSIGMTPSKSLYLIQPAAYGGVFILAFLILISSYSFAWVFYTRKWKFLFIPLAVIMLHFFAGYILYNAITKQIEANSNEKISVALILPSLKPETVWDEKNADALVTHLFTLNDKAIAQKPDLIVWTETVVPWTFTRDDDFLKEITIASNANNSHILIGMNSAIGQSGSTISNSVYLLMPSGKTYERYDKQDLLTMVEKPLFAGNGKIILPFLATHGISMKEGQYKEPVETPWGKAGILICNESTNSSLAAEHVKNGASFLVNMGNDSWFADYFIPRQHFYNCRLRAVENRKDILINNNMGVAGITRASGEIVLQSEGRKSNVKFGEIFPNTISSANSSIFIYLIVFVLLLTILNKLLSQLSTNN